MSGGRVTDPYGCPNKHASRAEMWRELATFRHPPLARVLLLTGPRRYELDVVLERGFRIENIYMVEYKPAMWANFTRHLKGRPVPPPQNQLHMLLSQAVRTLVARGIHIDVAHLDFCSNCEGKVRMLDEIRTVFASDLLSLESMIGITLLKGREHHVEEVEGEGTGFGVTRADPGCQAAQVFNSWGFGNRGRVRRVWEILGRGVSVVKMGEYTNTRTRNPMMWGILLRTMQVPPKAPVKPQIRDPRTPWY